MLEGSRQGQDDAEECFVQNEVKAVLIICILYTDYIWK